jgi:GT2 family glycosyltransferase
VADVLAIVLTFEAPEHLARCIDALLAQSLPPSEILVIDNASSVAAALPRMHIPAGVLQLPENIGPAGGYAVGLTQFLGSTHQYAWVMDDDVRAEPECLRSLIQRAGAENSEVVVAPKMIDAATSRSFDSRGWLGLLIPRKAVEVAGIPRADFFFGVEDSEYFRDRLPLAGFPVVDEHSARVEVIQRAPGGSGGAWKLYYGVRNVTYQYLWNRPHVARSTRLKSLAFWLRQGFRVARESHDCRLMSYFVRGIIDGVFAQLGRRVEPSDANRP